MVGSAVINMKRRFCRSSFGIGCLGCLSSSRTSLNNCSTDMADTVAIGFRIVRIGTNPSCTLHGRTVTNGNAHIHTDIKFGEFILDFLNSLNI